MLKILNFEPDITRMNKRIIIDTSHKTLKKNTIYQSIFSIDILSSYEIRFIVCTTHLNMVTSSNWCNGGNKNAFLNAFTDHSDGNIGEQVSAQAFNR